MSPPLKRSGGLSVSPERSHSSSSALSSHGATSDKFLGTKKQRLEGVTPQRKSQKPINRGAGSSSSSTSFQRQISRGMESPGSRMGQNPAQARTSSKKLLIRPFSTPPQMPDEYFNQTWENELLGAIRAIQDKQPVRFSYEELYRKVEDLCRGNKTTQLVAKLEAECEKHIAKQLKDLEDSTLSQEDFLASIDRIWEDYFSELLTIRSIFLFLDRKYVIHTTYEKNLFDMGVQVFVKRFTASTKVMDTSIKGIVSLIDKDRMGEVIDKSLFKRLLTMFASTKLNTSQLEQSILTVSTDYFRVKSLENLQENDIVTYLRYVERQMSLESERISCLHQSTRRALSVVLEKNLLVNHLSSILAKGFDQLCDETRVEDLKLLNRLFGVADLHDGCEAYSMLRDSFGEYVREKVDQIVSNPEQDDSMVPNLLDFMEKRKVLCEEAFENNEAIADFSKQTMEKQINKRPNKPAEYVAKHIDHILKAGNKKYSEDELTSTLDKLIVLFRRIQGKDIFEAFYERDLAKRLLFDRSASLDLENSMISKLKVECGASFTRKLEGMFKDVDLSTDIMHSFRENRRSAGALGDIELKVNVLTTGFWPSMAKEELKLPRELNDCQETFTTFYLESHKSRVLRWQYGNGSCVLSATFPKRRHLLSVSLYQTLILLLFNKVETLTYKEILAATGLSESELKRALLSLACGRHRVILKQPKGKVVDEDDSFVYNSGFEKPLVHLKINSIQAQSTPEEKLETTETVFKERVHHIDLAIVRIMKMRQMMTHSRLITELLEQLKFPHPIPLLKKRIEYLIENLYIERDPTNQQKYKYLA